MRSVFELCKHTHYQHKRVVYFMIMMITATLCYVDDFVSCCRAFNRKDVAFAVVIELLLGCTRVAVRTLAMYNPEIEYITAPASYIFTPE